jgi:hypothetical protein
MESVTLEKAQTSILRAFLILAVIVLYLVYKLISSGINLEYLIIIGICIIGGIAVMRVKTLVSQRKMDSEVYKPKGLDLLIGPIILILLGGLSLYLMLYKGFYDGYFTIKGFQWSIAAHWFYTLVKIFTIVLSYLLFMYAYNIHKILGALKKDNVNTNSTKEEL